MSAPNDADLVAAAQTGNLEAWSTLCHRHAPRLSAYLGSRLRRPQVVEKIVEDAIVAAWKHLPELENPNEFPAWFRRIGANLALLWYREHQNERLTEPFPAKRCGSDPKVADRMNRIEEALGKLSDAQRMALEQHYRGGMRDETLSESMHMDLNAARKLLDEALLALDRALQR